MRLFILDDIYTEKIIRELLEINSELNFPILNSVRNPLDYLVNINNETDIILLDHWFMDEEGWENWYWNHILWELLNNNKDYKIICISDNGKRLLDIENYKIAEQKWFIKWWITSKSWKDIYDMLVSNKLI